MRAGRGAARRPLRARGLVERRDRGASCAEGQQDRDGDGVCAPSCAATSCAAHQACDDASGAAVCACVTGYVLEGAECVWRGGPLDPSFQNQPTAWKTSGGAVLQPSGKGKVDPGLVDMAADVACQPGAGASQAFPMPAFAVAEPLALEVTATASSDFYEDPPSLAVDLGGGHLGFLAFGESSTQRTLCLGERAFGGDVELRLRAAALSACTPESRLTLDRAAIVAAPACPAPGTIPNSDFEGNGGWTVSGTSAEVATGMGSKGGRAGHLVTTNKCQQPSLNGVMSAPLRALARPALTFSYKGSTGAEMLVSGGSPLGSVAGSNTFQAARVCLPEWAKGVVLPLRFSLPDKGGLCADPNPRDFVFDDLAFASEPSCPDQAWILDGGFEESPHVLGWQLAQSTEFTTSARVLKSATAARSGASGLLLSVGQVCATASARQTITVPPPAGGAGPAIKLWYKLTSATTARFSTSPGGTLAPSADWTQKIICLPPGSDGRPLAFSIAASGGPGTCANTFPSERIYVDDVEVTTDPSCPAAP